eukprot:9642029-Alexandrium_andersonii.AAC.1
MERQRPPTGRPCRSAAVDALAPPASETAPMPRSPQCCLSNCTRLSLPGVSSRASSNQAGGRRAQSGQGCGEGS